MLSFEEIRTGKEGIELSYEAGQGYKYYYQLLINMCGGQPCLTNIYVEEHNSTAQYQATHQSILRRLTTKATSLFIVTDAISQCSYGWETMSFW